MAPLEASGPGIAYRGSALLPLDAQGRVTVPTFLRVVAEKASESRALVLRRHPTKACIEGLRSMRVEADEVERLRHQDEEGHFARTRQLFATTESVPWDREGRIVLPALLRGVARIEDRILFVGCETTFEMWNPAVAMSEGDEELRALADSHLGGDRAGPAVPASGWTGRFTAAERTMFVKALIPDALAALDQIIAGYEHNLHNRPPEPLEREALQSLRRLHAELGILLDVLDSPLAADAVLKRIRKLATGLWTFAVDGSQLLVAGTPALLLSVPASYGLIKLLELIFGAFGPDGDAAVAAAVAGGFLTLGKRPPKFALMSRAAAQ